ILHGLQADWPPPHGPVVVDACMDTAQILGLSADWTGVVLEFSKQPILGPNILCRRWRRLGRHRNLYPRHAPDRAQPLHDHTVTEADQANRDADREATVEHDVVAPIRIFVESYQRADIDGAAGFPVEARIVATPEATPDGDK